MDVLAPGTAAQFEALQNFCLERGTKSLGGLQTIAARSKFELVD